MIDKACRAILLAAALGGSVTTAVRAEAEHACAQVGRTLPSDLDIASALARQLDAPSVQILQSFAYKSWRILYVATPAADNAYLFFSGDPSKQHYIALWSGGAQPNEVASIRHWTLVNAHGIPSPLARCFAEHVTRHRDL